MATIKLPSYQPPVEQARRPTATSINRSQPREQNLTVSGYNEVVPLVYGVDKVSGPMIAGPVSRGGWAYWGVAISHGPIDGYDKVIIGTDEHEVTAMAQTITGDGFTYHLTFYDGTQTNVDANLSEGIEFFGDVFNGVAYVSVKAQGENMSMTNGLVFKIRGKKVLDPRDNTLKFTENPALHLNDFITNSYYGLGREAIGVNALADHCDSSFGGAPRCRTSTVMQSGLSEESAIDLLATYAEALWAYQGGSVYLVPDAAVAQEDIIDIPMQQIFGGSVQLMTELAQDIPSSVTLTYNSDASDGLAGEPVFVSKEEATASTPYLNSSLTLMGVYRRAEAQRRAEQRLARLQIGGRVSFQMFDTGSLLKIGDVIRFPDRYGIGGMLLRVMASPELVSLGVYQIRTEVYDESIYSPSEGVGAVVLPKGAVVPLFGDGAVPTGFSVVDVGDGAYIKGSELSDSIEKVGDSISIDIEEIVETEYAGDHEADLSVEGRSSGDKKEKPLDGSHKHALTVKIKNADVLKSRTTKSRFIISEEDTAIPRGAVFLHESELRTTSYFFQEIAGGYAFAAPSGEVELSSRVNLKTFRTTSGGYHDHSELERGGVDFFEGFPVYPFKSVPTAWAKSTSERETPHTHDAQIEINLMLESVHLNLHTMLVNGASVPVGGVIGYVGSEVPSGWALCDGSNGTVDLRDKFIGYTGDKDLPKVGNNVEIKGYKTSDSGRHTHARQSVTGINYFPPKVANKNHAPDAGLHTHEINYEKTIPFTPRHIKLAFIQYVGE